MSIFYYEQEPKITIASKSQLKFLAVANQFKKVIPEIIRVESSSEVGEQPMGREEIRTGALNRIKSIDVCHPVISLETGIIGHSSTQFFDVTCCILKTRYGLFEMWSEKFPIPMEYIENWDRKTYNTLGKWISVTYHKNNKDWYQLVGGSKSRLAYLTDLVKKILRKFEIVKENLQKQIIPAPLYDFKGVKFLDIQKPLLSHPKELTMGMKRLTDRLLFDRVLVLESRGFLFAEGFMREGYPVIIARKPGKLPTEELYTVEYEKEYGIDKLCIEKDAISSGANVLVIDDVIATGGTMVAAEQLIKKGGGKVVAFLAPFAIEVDVKLLGHTALGSRMRYLMTQIEANDEYKRIHDKSCELKRMSSASKEAEYSENVYIVPPSLKIIIPNLPMIDVDWNQFRYSSDIWINFTPIRKKITYILLNPMLPNEMIDVLKILNILYRKNPKKIIIVIPFLEQATQDRIEYKDDKESVAAVDTLNKLIRKHTVYTFDLHALQSQFAFFHMEVFSLVKELWERYKIENPNSIPVFPDEGAGKRFGNLLKLKEYVSFRKVRDGDKRYVSTDAKFENGKRYVIIDDLVRSGGTMREVCKYLFEKTEAKSVDALFAHAPLTISAPKNMEVFNDIWTSDSCPQIVPPKWIKLGVVDMINKFPKI